MSCGCCIRQNTPPINNNNSIYKTNEVIIEKRYGIYQFGLLLALVIIFILLLACIPLFFSSSQTLDNLYSYQKNYNDIILLGLVILFVIIGVCIVIFVNYQHKKAFEERMKSKNGIYTLERNRQRRRQQPSDMDVELKKMPSKTQSKPQLHQTSEIKAKYAPVKKT